MTTSLRSIRPGDGAEAHPPLYPGNSFNPQRPLLSAVLRGLACRCPACGAGRLYHRFLKMAPTCAHCGEALHHARPDDAPAYFVMLIVGHVVVSMALSLELSLSPPIWITLLTSMLAACGLTFALLPCVKGAIIALQWTFWMHGFDPHEQDDLPPVAQHCDGARDQARAA